MYLPLASLQLPLISSEGAAAQHLNPFMEEYQKIFLLGAPLLNGIFFPDGMKRSTDGLLNGDGRGSIFSVISPFLLVQNK